ncbi:MAG TPA: helix-turn-helix domain-containing protein [Gaiellaceae bacterium]|jgi:tetratricopeptide (TPR) repeat protein|nr:helix-turn-helix domain-containing protein [Gaiellaceae bacterium]
MSITVATEVGAPEAETIGQRLRRLRTERRLSQRELSSPGVSYAYISRIEAGTRQPSVKALRMLARKLGVSAEYLETGSELGAAEERELKLADAELKLRLGEDPAEAEQVLSDVLEEALAAGDRTAANRARITLGLASAQRGDHARTIGLLEEAIASAELSPRDRPDVFSTLGEAYVAIGTPVRAVELFERSLAEVSEKASDDVSAQVRFASYLSSALSDMGEVERAEAVMSEALARSEGFTDPYTRVRLYWSLARLSEFEGKYVAALDYARRAIALLQATDDSLHLARAHLLAAWIMGAQGNAEASGRHLDFAERLLGPHPEPVDLARLRTEQAKRAALLGNGDEAVERARAALELLGDTYELDQGSAAWALAEGLALQGDIDAAGKEFERAVTLLSENRRLREAAQAARGWGRMLRNAGREAEALDVLERATDLAVRGENPEASRHR